MAVEIFLQLKYQGDGKLGDSKAVGHEGDIQVQSWSWGVSNSGVMSGDRKASSGEFQDLSISKRVDAATNDLLEMVATGARARKATLTIRTSRGSMKPVDILVIELDDVAVSSLYTNVEEHGDMQEQVTLSYRGVTFSYTEIDQQGKPSKPQRFKFDLDKKVAP